MRTISVELNSRNVITSNQCSTNLYSWQLAHCMSNWELIKEIVSKHMLSSNIPQSLTLSEFLNRLGYANGGITIVSLNTSHPIPIHTSDSQKYYLIIDGKRRLIPDIQTLRYLEHKYNFNENRDVLNVSYSQIEKYPDGGSFTSVIASTRAAQQSLTNLFQATNAQYTDVITASSVANSIISQGSITLDNYNSNLNMAQSYYNLASSSYNKGKQELQTKFPLLATKDFNAAKVSNTLAVNYVNKAKISLAALNVLKPKYTTVKNALLNMEQKYQLILTTIAKQLGLATSNAFIEANTSGLEQIQVTGSMATSKATASINQINSSLKQLASVDITKVSVTTITSLVSNILSQKSAINSVLDSYVQQTTSSKTKSNTKPITTTVMKTNPVYSPSLPPEHISKVTNIKQTIASTGINTTTTAGTVVSSSNLKKYIKYLPLTLGGILIISSMGSNHGKEG